MAAIGLLDPKLLEYRIGPWNAPGAAGSRFRLVSAMPETGRVAGRGLLGSVSCWKNANLCLFDPARSPVVADPGSWFHGAYACDSFGKRKCRAAVCGGVGQCDRFVCQPFARLRAILPLKCFHLPRRYLPVSRSSGQT